MKFMALGGTDRVGASCYYIELAGTKFLLDCGKGICRGRNRVFSPAFGDLLSAGEMHSLTQIDAVLLSHAHFDHIGALPEFTNLCPDTPVFATTLTKQLGDYLLYDKLVYTIGIDQLQSFKKKFQTEQAMNRVHTVGFGRSMTIGSVRITFYEAGHIPGAAMIYLESEEGNILYTGDFKSEATALTDGVQLPSSVRPDTVILCGLHAKHPFHHAKHDVRGAVGQLSREGMWESVCLSVSQLTKGLEVLVQAAESFPNEEIYLENSLYLLAERMSALGISVISEKCRHFPISSYGMPSGIYIGSRAMGESFQTRICMDFSLHAEYESCLSLVHKLSPKTVFLVHSPPDMYGNGDQTFQQACQNCTVIQPIQGQLYQNKKERILIT